MSDISLEKLAEYVKNVSRPHPWHGIKIAPKDGSYDVVNAFIEIVPGDTVKYELDKDSGYLTIDRPNKLSNIMPCMYGFVPQTYCNERVAAHTSKALGDDSVVGDQDPLDICVLTERDIKAGDFFLEAKILGGFRMLDGGEADDKIIAVLKDDHVMGHYNDVSELPSQVVTRLEHFFLTYKGVPKAGEKAKVEITHTYSAEEAKEIIKLSHEDYKASYDFGL